MLIPNREFHRLGSVRGLGMSTCILDVYDRVVCACWTIIVSDRSKRVVQKTTDSKNNSSDYVLKKKNDNDACFKEAQ